MKLSKPTLISFVFLIALVATFAIRLGAASTRAIVKHRIYIVPVRLVNSERMTPVEVPGYRVVGMSCLPSHTAQPSASAVCYIAAEVPGQ
ncbi:MAG: hypothetical protein ACRD4R_16060 [Candidatus Acidiferrales bacterium]